MPGQGPSWGVIGGGVLGLTLAHRLAQQGCRVKVIEAAPALGGLAAPWQLGNVVWDRHYHVTLLSDQFLLGLLDELGLKDDLHWTVTRTGFFAGDGLYPLNDAIDYLRFPPLNLIDKVRLAATILYVSRLTDGRRLEKIPLADWLTRLSGKRTFELIWRPLLRAKLGENYKRASAAFIWAVIQRLYAARRSGLKREMFGYVSGGYDRIFERFAERLRNEDVDIQLATAVKRVDRNGTGVAVDTGAETLTFDNVVLTLPARAAAQLCPGLNDDERERLGGIVYQGIVCASVLTRTPPDRNYLTYITDDDIPFTAVVEMSSLVDPAEIGGHGLIYLPKYVTSDDPFFEVDDAEVERTFLAGLRRIYPEVGADDVLAFRVSRVRAVLAVSTLNYSDRLPPMTTSVPGVHIVNSAHIVNGTLNVNETIALAEQALPQLLVASRSSGSA